MASTTSITSWMVSKYPPDYYKVPPPGLRHEGPKTKKHFMTRSAKTVSAPMARDKKNDRRKDNEQ